MHIFTRGKSQKFLIKELIGSINLVNVSMKMKQATLVFENKKDVLGDEMRS